MYPAADDNYGLDACSLLCLHSQPPVIAMATGSGKIYHCIALESEESYNPEEVGPLVPASLQACKILMDIIQSGYEAMICYILLRLLIFTVQFNKCFYILMSLKGD